MELGLRGKVAVVAGGSQGLGYASGLALAEEGAHVLLLARTKEAVEKAAATISEQTSSKAAGMVCDVTRADNIAAAIATAESTWGRLDVLVTNSGGPPPGRFGQVDDAAWQAAFDLLLLSTVRLVRASLPLLEKAPAPRIVMLTSTTVKQPNDDLLLSNAVRIGVAGLCKSLSRDLAAKKITVNQVCPGRIATERVASLDAHRSRQTGKTAAEVQADHERNIPLGRYGRPEELGRTVAFLASEAASYITGATICVDGGLTAGVF